jgi:Flp pilus assembly protein TadD
MQARHPDDYRSYLHLAYTARDSGRDVEAIEHFRAAAARFPGDPEMLTDGATVALRLRDTVTARAWLERAVAVSPRAARARTRLFGVLLARGDSAAARRLLVEGLEREPGQRAWAALLASLDAGRPRRD